ncbi:MAG TPA: glutathione S-transferase family protein [Solirubrobacterales bacterium]|nr:glutathione S-transferase family protein [Solirubrobacterales bacterium]
MSDELPTLWQIDVSHYSEKARWALAWKGVEHRRRSPVPGAHMAVALWLTRGAQYTLPVLSIGGQRIGDSTAIIAALEERFPNPPLYPADISQRRRALELEEFFDEELGPPIRQLVWHELSNDRDRFASVLKRTAPAPLARFSAATVSYGRVFTGLRFNARDAEMAERSRAKVLAALNRLDAELETTDSDYLVGDAFTVADLTAASLFYPLAGPEGAPLPPDQPMPEGFERFRAPLKERHGLKWVREMFRRHRKPTQARAAAPASG